MTDPLRFDNRVAIVTGAGTGLGRAYALELARRGAMVVVNDLGAGVDGAGASDSAAAGVVSEINAAGGQAMAHGADVTDAAAVADMVNATIHEFGRIDILINNAGILRDRSFAKMTAEDFASVIAVHLTGAFNCTKAVWETMKTQGYGRIAMTTSSSGLYGNFGQANYGAAKMGLVGLMNVLAIEGAKNDIRVNAIAPVAATRMTEDLLAPEARDRLTPESVAAGMMTLVHETAPNRMILSAGAGGFAAARIMETEGVMLSGDDLSAEGVASSLDRITNMDGARHVQQGAEQTIHFLTRATANDA